MGTRAKGLVLLLGLFGGIPAGASERLVVEVLSALGEPLLATLALPTDAPTSLPTDSPTSDGFEFVHLHGCAFSFESSWDGDGAEDPAGPEEASAASHSIPRGEVQGGWPEGSGVHREGVGHARLPGCRGPAAAQEPAAYG